MRRIALLFLLALLVLPACGGSSDNPQGGAEPGFPYYVLPFLPVGTGETLTYGFKNMATSAATVYVEGFDGTGASYAAMTALTIPARGEIRRTQTSLIGAVAPTGGFLHVDTRDVTTPDADGFPSPVATTGLVIPYQLRNTSGNTVDATPGYGLGVPNVSASIVEGTIGVQVANASHDATAVPTAADFDVVFYDPFGTPISSMSYLVPAHGSLELLPAVLTGHVEVTPAPFPQTAPAGTLFDFGVSGLEDDPQVAIEARFIEIGGATSRRLGFTLRHGTDVYGNVYDFAMTLTNHGGSDANVVIEAIRTASGANIIPAPRVVSLDANASKYLATTTVDSIGLDAGAAEQSPFNDIFGIPTGKDLEDFYVYLNVPATVDASVREDNFTFKQFRRIIPGRTVMNTAMIPGVEVQTTTQGGIHNWITVSNPTNGDKIVNISGFTPGGVEYILPQQVVPAFQAVGWSPDGLIFTETPEDPNATPVPYVAFRLSAQGGVIVDAYQERVSNPTLNLVQVLRPHVVRDISPR